MKQTNWTQTIFWDIYDQDINHEYTEEEEEVYDMYLIE
tara:strand:- start:18 stop:131 length:114 start_codon:yes stop_codon:yes gene_type:complete